MASFHVEQGASVEWSLSYHRLSAPTDVRYAGPASRSYVPATSGLMTRSMLPAAPTTVHLYLTFDLPWSVIASSSRKRAPERLRPKLFTPPRSSWNPSSVSPRYPPVTRNRHRSSRPQAPPASWAWLTTPISTAPKSMAARRARRTSPTTKIS